MDILLGLALSQHLNFQNDYNEIHPHIRLQQDGFIAGAYYNSTKEVSPYIGYRLEHNELGLELGIAGGYSEFGTVVPYTRGTYDITDSMILFVAPAGEIQDNETNLGIVVGIDILAF